MNKQFRHKINSTMLFHRERPAALCPFLLKWKQSGEKKLKSMEPPPWQKIKKENNDKELAIIIDIYYMTS